LVHAAERSVNVLLSSRLQRLVSYR
jgi:hypothetical protein